MVAPELQRLAGLGMALDLVPEGMLWLTCQRLHLQPPRSRRRGQLANWLYREACRRPSLARSLVAELTPMLLPSRRWDGPPEPAQVVTVLKRSRRKGLALGLMWGMGETIDDPAWAACWNDWLRDSASWRRRLTRYVEMVNGADALQVAQSMVADAEAERDRMREALRAMAKACRQEIARLREEIEALNAVNRRLAVLRPLRDAQILVLGDPAHADGYRDLIQRYGGRMEFADGANRQAVRAALDGRYDAIVIVTAYGYHTTQMMVQKYARHVPLFFANRGGLGVMERVLVEQVIPTLFKRLRGLEEPASA